MENVNDAVPAQQFTELQQRFIKQSQTIAALRKKVAHFENVRDTAAAFLAGTMTREELFQTVRDAMFEQKNERL
jgi:hypothetical protein